MRFSSSHGSQSLFSHAATSHKKSWLIGAALLVVLTFAQASWATPVTITSLVYVHPSPNVDCEDTIPGEPAATACSPVGVTNAGSLTNAFLNDVNTKAINIGFGDYYTFGNPYGPTDFMIQGDAIEVLIGLSDGTLLSDIFVVPDLSVAGTTLFDFASNGITITTTGITSADRMSFGLPPAAFAADGTPDYTLELTYVPEPASATLLLTALAAVPALRRRRIAG